MLVVRVYQVLLLIRIGSGARSNSCGNSSADSFGKEPLGLRGGSSSSGSVGILVLGFAFLVVQFVLVVRVYQVLPLLVIGSGWDSSSWICFSSCSICASCSGYQVPGSSSSGSGWDSSSWICFSSCSICASCSGVAGSSSNSE